MVFIKQQSNFERRCFLVLVQQCLHQVPCLSVIFSPFSFLGENRNAPTCQICQILSLTSPSKLAASATFTLPLDLCEQQRTNENRPAWADAKCSSHFPLLCSVVVENNGTFCPEELPPETITGPRRHRNPSAMWYRETDYTVTSRIVVLHLVIVVYLMKDTPMSANANNQT